MDIPIEQNITTPMFVIILKMLKFLFFFFKFLLKLHFPNEILQFIE